MVFNSFEYAIFLALVVALCWSLPRLRWQNGLLLAASHLFYARWDWRFLGLILLSTTVDFLAARTMPTADGRRRKLLLALSLATDLGILGFFKYFNFFVDSAVSVLNSVGIQANPSTLQIILPVGISFYTFQALSYTIEVYRGNLQPTRSFANYALFIAFFPQLTAGPIERAARMLPQLEMVIRIEPVRSLLSDALNPYENLLWYSNYMPAYQEQLQNGPHYNLWLVGSSHMVTGLQPEWVQHEIKTQGVSGLTVQNYGLTNMLNLYDMAAMFDRWMFQFDQPDYVVIGLSGFNFSINAIGDSLAHTSPMERTYIFPDSVDDYGAGWLFRNSA